MSGFQSMTGFGKGVTESKSFEVTVEIKTVNHRFRDIRFKMSARLNQIELPLRKKIEQRFKRGSFEIYINYKKAPNSAVEFKVDEQKVNAFLEMSKKIVDGHGMTMAINPADFLRSDFAVEHDDSMYDELGGLVHEAFDKCLEDLEVCRNEEGQKLKSIMLGHKEIYSEIYATIGEKAHLYRAGVEAKLKKSFEESELKNKIDDSRFLQEVVYYLEKLDVDEELNRIQAHLDKFDKIFAEGGEVGRQFEFILQEFNRETNTIGSKSGDTSISNAVVQMKVQLEKMREQALNLV